jgi:hypothetical protein
MYMIKVPNGVVCALRRSEGPESYHGPSHLLAAWCQAYRAVSSMIAPLLGSVSLFPIMLIAGLGVSARAMHQFELYDHKTEPEGESSAKAVSLVDQSS